MDKDVLQPHQLEERGLGREVFGPRPTPPVEGHIIMAIAKPVRASGATFTPDEDVIETLPDGRTIQIGVAGVPMPMREAIRMGLVPDPNAPAPVPAKAAAQIGPAETKEGEAPPAPKEKK